MKSTPILLLALLLLPGCAIFKPAPKAETKTETKTEAVRLQPASFKDLPGWNTDNIAAALVPMQKSCAVTLKKSDDAPFGKTPYAGTANAWKAACASLDITMTADAARLWFEENFTPYSVNANDDGLFTGYYLPLLKGSYKREAPYLTPLYTRPPDMVTVDLGAFKEELKGQTITGRVTRNKDGDARLLPYYTRSNITAGALASRPKVAFVDNPVDAFFLQIQGSGVVEMEDGGTVQVGYAAQNGHPYTAIGRTLIDRGALTKENVSMQSIRAWLETHPMDAPAVMNANESFVFFRPLKGGALGAQGVEITPHRSLAVDSKMIPYGAPLFLDTQDPDGAPLQKLMIAQDTGGAIKGAVRADYFWGAGAQAADKAGRMKSKGRYFILLPKSLTP